MKRGLRFQKWSANFRDTTLATTLHRFTNETELRNGLLQEDQLPSFKYQKLKQNEASA